MELKDINKEIQDFESRNIQVVPGLSFNQHDMIEKIFFYYNSKFQSGDIDEDGNRKYFYNIVKNPCKVFQKAIDFDTKNIRLITTGGGDPWKTWFLERDLKYWMRDKQFGKVLNRIFKELPIFGSVVLKIIKGTPYFVDLRNFVIEQSADTLKDANYVMEIHNFTVPAFRKAGKKMGWDPAKVEEAIDEFYQMKDVSHIRVFERYGEEPQIDNKGFKSYAFKRTFIADVGVEEYDQYQNILIEKNGVLLQSDDWDPDNIPYREFHMDKVPGRWLGVGIVEQLVEPQIRQNELVNLQAKASYWNATRLFFSRDPKVVGNLVTEHSNGDVLTGDDPITQIDMSDRNLAYFNQEAEKWMANRDELTFSYDVVQGERLPAGTPLGSAQLAVSQTLSYFEGIQEEVALDVKEMLYKDILPTFHKENNQKHTIRLVGKDLDTYVNMVKNELVFKEVVRLVTKGQVPDEQLRKTVEAGVVASLKQGNEKLLEVPKDWYEGLKYDIDIDITGESIDTRVRNATRFALLQAMTADPTMTTDPVKKKMLYGMAEDGGINPADLFSEELSEPADIAAVEARKAGGGVSAPAMAGAALGGAAEQTI